jgi:hypothetical protein
METFKLTIAFLAGLLAGLALSWSVIRSLKARVRFYETYIHERINRNLEAPSSGS